MRIVSWLIAATAAAGAGGCAMDLVCGDGTIERDGACVISDLPPRDPAACGEGTVFNPSTQECETGFEPTECDPATTVPIVGPDGVVVCVGTGSDSCDRELACRAPDADKISICGRLVDTGSSALVQAGDGSSTEPCAQATFPTDAGPCALAMTVFDALDFATNPGGAIPLPVEQLTVDECGRFEARNIQRPTSGFLGIAVDDDPAGANDDYTLTGFGALAIAGVAQPGFHAYATLRATDAAWTSSAGDPEPLGGDSFAQHGVYVGVYLRGAEPVPGVQITVLGQPRPNQSFYFSDADPAARETVDPALGETGANGTALLIDSDALVGHGGAGGEEPGCEWPGAAGRTVPGVVFVQEYVMQVTGGGEACP